MSRATSEAAATAAGLAMGALAAVRRGKAVHPQGDVYEATLRVTGAAHAPRDASLLARPGEHRAIVRFSRSLGVPRPLPDLLGLSLRVLDAYGRDRHQDLLLVTSIDRPVLRHVFVPARGIADRVYSSSLPYRAGHDQFVVGAVPISERRFHLAVAPLTGKGSFQPVAEIRLGARLDDVADALRFNPFNTGGGLEPAGRLNALRRRAYPMSQRTWGRVRPGAAERQRQAEAVTERRV
jgi:hypothetical protein